MDRYAIKSLFILLLAVVSCSHQTDSYTRYVDVKIGL